MRKSIKIEIDTNDMNDAERLLIDKIRLTAYGELMEKPPHFELYGRTYTLESVGSYELGGFNLTFNTNQKL